MEPYTKKHDHYDSNYRTVIVDFLVEVHKVFALCDESFYLCIDILDRYLYTTSTRNSSLQLVAIASLIISSKYEDDQHLHVSDCAYPHSRKEIVQMEYHILCALNWKVAVPTMQQFAHIYLSVVDASLSCRRVTNYFMTKCTLDDEMLKYKYSHISCCCVVLAMDISQALLEGHAPGSIPTTFNTKAIPKRITELAGLTNDEVVRLCDVIYRLSSKRFYNKAKELLTSIEDKYGISHSSWV